MFLLYDPCTYSASIPIWILFSVLASHLQLRLAMKARMFTMFCVIPISPYV